MLRSSRFIMGCPVRATDGPGGSVVDLLFEDAIWTVRWAVVETGSWLYERRVLVPPQRLVPADSHADAFAIPLTCAQVEASPPEESDLPVSRRYEQMLFAHYQWDPYWTGGGLLGVGLPPQIEPSTDVEPPKGDDHLRSVRHVKGAAVRTRDGEIGHVVDLLVDPQDWTIPLIEIATRNWLPGHKVVVSSDLVAAIDWYRPCVTVRQSRAELEACPRYRRSMTDDRGRLRRLFSHFGLPTDRI